MTANAHSNGHACVLYGRVSTAQQALDGISLAAQRDRLNAWASAHAYRVIAHESDAGISGKRADNRPGVQAAITLACEHKAALVVYSLSRLGRSTQDILAIADRLDRAGADLVSVSESIDTTNAAGKMVFRLLAVLAEFERDLASERTRAALAHKRRRGEKTGGRVPFGYRVRDGLLVPIPEQQEAIRIGLDLYRRGRSYRAIARHWHQHGYTERPLNHKTIAAVLRRHQSSPFEPTNPREKTP